MFSKFIPIITKLFICLILILFGCQKDNTNPLDNENVQKTLSSLEKIDDFPFYTVTYYNDYHFDEFLQTGNRPEMPIDVVVSTSVDNRACTCISSGNGNNRYFGRNQDSGGRVTVALLVFTHPQDGYSSISHVWTPCLNLNKNQLPDSSEFRNNLLLAPYFPTDGMNENGVAIADMSVFSADAPYNPQKITIYRPDVIRLVLDYATDVEHAISLISKYNVDLFEGGGNPTHYLIADSSGNSAVLEWDDGQMKVVQDDNPWQVSTNFIISRVNIPDEVTCSRYKTAYNALQECNGKLNNYFEAMDIMKSVSNESTTWSCVYDLKNTDVKIVIKRKYDDVYSFSL